MKTEKTITEELGLKNLKLGELLNLDGVVVDLINMNAIKEFEISEWEEGARVFIEGSGKTGLVMGNKLPDLLQAIDRAMEGEGSQNILSGVSSAIGTPYQERAENFDLLASF